VEETSYLKGRQDLLDILRKIPFFRSYEDFQLLDILTLSKMRKYLKNEIITKEGDYDSWLYIILAGKVDVVKNSMIVASIEGLGGTIGEMALIDGEPRSASVLASTDTTFLSIDMSFQDRMNDTERGRFDAVYYRLLSTILADRLRKTTEELMHTKRQVKQLMEGIPAKE